MSANRGGQSRWRQARLLNRGLVVRDPVGLALGSPLLPELPTPGDASGMRCRRLSQVLQRAGLRGGRNRTGLVLGRVRLVRPAQPHLDHVQLAPGPPDPFNMFTRNGEADSLVGLDRAWVVPKDFEPNLS